MGTIATTATITVDLQHPEINKIHAKQFDSLSRYADIKLLSSGQPWTAESSISYAIQYAKPDGTKGMYDKLPDGTTDAVTAGTDDSGCTVLRARFAPQMLTVAGRVRFSVAMLQTDGTKLQTFSATLEVEPSEVNDDASKDYYKMVTIDELIEEVKKRVKSVNNILPNTSGDVYINAESINAQVPSLAYQGSVDGALEALATMPALPVARASSTDGITYTATGGVLPTVSVADNMSQISAVGKGRQIVFIPLVKNQNDAPTLRLNGGEIIPIRIRAPKNQGTDDSVPTATLPVSAGALMRGVPYTMTFCGKYWLIDSQIAQFSCAANEYQASVMREMAEVASGMADGDTIGMPIINSMDGIAHDVSRAWIARSADEDAAPPEDGSVVLPTEQRVEEMIRKGLSSLSEEKVSLPKAEDGTAIPGTAGWYAVSDGAGGITWVESAPSTGGGGETTTHSIIWDLVNVNSSNNAVSVADGASLVAVLTPADGYSLGDVTITMGGEVVTGAWNADTATVTIQSVTGDVMISCTGVEQTGPVDTSPVIAQSDVGYNASGVVKSFPGVAITKSYEFTPDIDGIKASGYYDETNDYTTLTGITGVVAVYTPNTKMVEAGYSTSGMTANASKTALFRDGVFAAAMSNACLTGNNTQVTLQFARHNTNTMHANSIAFTISELDADDSYAYWTTVNHTVLPVGVRAGDIIFAGKNTPYYGMANIDGTRLGEAATTALSLDDDIAQDYGAATLSLTPDLSADTSTAYGLSSAYASVLETIRDEWMIEYNGNANKIPIIIHTDQHGRMTNGGNVKGLFNTIGKAFSLHDISKVMNLGDTVSVEWKDADAEHPLLSCTTLENYLSTVEAIPFSKRLEVFGNHDTWYYNGYKDEGNAVGTRYPSTQNHLYKYFRNIYKKSNGNNSGYFAVCDDYFNVKYVVVSAYEYQNGTISDRMTSEQIEWIIREFSKDDGYDIVVVSHCPLYWDDVTGTFPEGAPTTTETLRIADDWIDALWAGRKNKTSGTVNDSDGGSHTFDFTGCTSNLLCALHGHTHRAGYNYVSDSLLSVAFDWFANESMYFCLIDRENRELKVWKFIGSDGDAPEYMTWVAPFDKQ